MKSKNNGIGDRIELLLKERGIKQIDLTKKINISSSAISFLKKSDGIPAADTALKIAYYFGVDPVWLVFGQNIPNDETFSNVKNAGIKIPVEEYRRLKLLEYKIAEARQLIHS